MAIDPAPPRGREFCSPHRVTTAEVAKLELRCSDRAPPDRSFRLSSCGCRTPLRHTGELRVSPRKRRIERAAELVHESASDFARTAAEHRAEAVLLEHDTITIVPADYFDQLRAARDEEPRPSPALKRAGQRARRTVQR